MEVQGAANWTLGMAKNVMLNLPGAYFPAKSVAVIDFTEWQPEFGRPCDGILGYDFFRRLVVRMDYENKQITLYDPATFVPQISPDRPKHSFALASIRAFCSMMKIY